MTAPITTDTPEMESVEPQHHAPDTQTTDEFWDAADITPDAPGEAPPPDPESGQPRGPDGKFLPKSKDEATTQEGSPDAPAAPSAIQPSATPDGQPPAVNPADVFRYRAMGQTHAAEGIVANADGSLVVKAEAVPKLREAFNALHLAQGEFAPALERKEAKIRELTQAVEARTLAEAKHEAALAALTTALQLPDENAFIEQMYALREGLPNLMAKAEADYWRQRAEQPAPPQADAQPSPQDTAPTLPSPEEAYQSTRESVEEFKLQHEFRDLTPEDWKQLDASLQRTPLAFLRPATAEEATQYGVRAGQLVLDTDQLHAHVTALATQARTQRETAERTVRLATETARRTTPQVHAPPTAGGSKAPPKGERRIQSKQDMEDYWDSDEV